MPEYPRTPFKRVSDIISPKVDGDSLDIPTGRCATLTVAANDSSALSKQQADFVCDGTADDVEIQAALDAIASYGGGKLVQLHGTYIWAAAVTYSASNLEWEGTDNVVNDCSAVSAGGAVKIEGEITGTNSALTGDASKGQKDITVADASSFSVGDWIRIRSEALFNSGTQHLGEMQMIASIAGNIITCEDVLAFGYDVADTGTIDLLNVYENISLKNMHFIGNYGTSNWTGILFREGHNVLIEDIHWTDSYCYPILVYDVVGFEVRGCNVKDSDQAGLGYGVNISNASRDILIHYNKFYNCRHGIACGGDNTYGVQTNQIYNSNTFRYSTQTSGAMGPHNTYDGLIMSNNNVMDDGLGYVAGLNTSVIGNTVINAIGSQGLRLVTGGKYIDVTGNIISTVNQDGIILAGNSSHIIISNNEINTVGGNAIYDQESSSNLVIVSNIISSTQRGIFLRHNGATSDTEFITIGNNFIKSSHSSIRIGIFGFDVNNVNIVGNMTDSAGAGILVWGENSGGVCNNININDNFCDATSYGITISEANHFNINSNMILNSTTGIFIRNVFSGCFYYKTTDNHLINCTTNIDDEEGTGTVFKQYSDLLMDVLAVSTTHIRSNEDLSEAIPNTFTLDAQPDIPRTLSWSFDTHAQITEYDMEVVGIDAKGNTVTETWDETAGWSGETSNAFATITSIKMTSRTGTGVADTMDIGITDVLGLSNVIYETSDVFKIKKNNANATVATAQVNTTYDTYDMSVIGLGAGDDFTIWYKSNLNIIS